MYSIIVLTLVMYGEMILGSCDVKLESSLLKDLVEMFLKKDSYKTCELLNRKTIPAFSAVLTKQISLSTNKVVKFDKVFTNIQNGYSPSTGIFTAPLAGVYQFTSVIMSQNGKTLIASLWHNTIKIASMYTTSSTYQTGSLSMVLDLKKKDQVVVKSYSNSQYSSNIFYSDPNHYSTFSGYLIAK
ncbi:complement C1q-like protein 3 [Mytilus edulis]|uniref:complement C1q-like protein 3 n=1 Tax=Mytilus edulis TaxID=6550 RepID=UPI0039EE13D2